LFKTSPVHLFPQLIKLRRYKPKPPPSSLIAHQNRKKPSDTITNSISGGGGVAAPINNYFSHAT
jgi:hypothetical protein